MSVETMTATSTTHSFASFSLPEPLLRSLVQMKFTQPTPIQSAAIPVALAGRDLIASAQTGTGKTAAFAIPIVTKLMADPQATALVLAPTRELAIQISEVIKQLSSHIRGLNSALLIGGSPMGKQFHELSQKPRIIVATPGRLNDHLGRRSVNLSQVKILVLDEGDRMLDMGFEPQIQAVLNFIPKERQVLLFSATMPERIRLLSKKYMKNPERISIGSDSKPVDKIRHSVITTTKKERNDILLDELNARTGSVIIFVNTKHGTDRLMTYLSEYGYAVTKIHGGRSQGQRNVALNGFRSKKFRILVATDVAARGLDVPHIEHVLNYDLPKDIDDYVHRIGRTARAGAAGEAICFVSPEDRNHWNKICFTYKLMEHSIGVPRENKQKSFGNNKPQQSFQPRQQNNRFDYSKDRDVRQAKKEDQTRKEYIKQVQKSSKAQGQRNKPAVKKGGGSNTPWWLGKRISKREPDYA
ncbi:MAG: DEAD/DEAH box helicase [Bdellovibrionales bacterium]